MQLVDLQFPFPLEIPYYSNVRNKTANLPLGFKNIFKDEVSFDQEDT
jgi:hypothetical protein